MSRDTVARQILVVVNGIDDDVDRDRVYFDDVSKLKLTLTLNIHFRSIVKILQPRFLKSSI